MSEGSNSPEIKFKLPQKEAGLFKLPKKEISLFKEVTQSRSVIEELGQSGVLEHGNRGEGKMIFEPDFLVRPEDVDPSIPVFPIKEMLLSDEKEAEVEDIKKTSPRPTREGVLSIFDELTDKGEYYPEKTQNAIADWFSRSAWTWYENGEKNPYDYRPLMNSNEPMLREWGANAMIQEILMRSVVDNNLDLSEVSQMMIKGIIFTVVNGWSHKQRDIEKFLDEGGSDTFFTNPFDREDRYGGAVEERDFAERTKNQFYSIMNDLPALNSFAKAYYGNENARIKMADPNPFPARG